MPTGETRDGVALTNLDAPLFDGAQATKRDLVDYLDAVADQIIRVLADRPLSVMRVLRGRESFMQKNVPKYTPPWIRTRPTLLWFANQRAVEYHPTLVHAGEWDRPTHLVLDLDPPEEGGLATTAYVRADRNGKVFLDSTRSGGATVVAAYSPRIRPGTPVSFPVPWEELDRVVPADFTVRTAAELIGDSGPRRPRLTTTQGTSVVSWFLGRPSTGVRGISAGRACR